MTLLDLSLYWQMVTVGALMLAAMAQDRFETLRIDPAKL